MPDCNWAKKMMEMLIQSGTWHSKRQAELIAAPALRGRLFVGGGDGLKQLGVSVPTEEGQQQGNAVSSGTLPLKQNRNHIKYAGK